MHKGDTPYVCKLVDSGQIPCHYVGTHRRLKTAHVLAYAEQRRTKREQALAELVELSDAAGLYDDDF